MTDTNKRCECCGTTKNVVNKGMWTPAWYCGPHNTCAENKEIDTDKYEGHTEGPWSVSEEYGLVIKHGQGPHDFVCMDNEANAQLMADAPLLLEFIQKVVEEWGKPNQCNKAFGKDVRHLMLLYGLINYNEETRRFEVKE